MPEQTHARPSRSELADIADEAVAQSERAKTAREDLADVDDLLDEIDAVLEEVGAEELVKNYVQRGGE